MKKQTIVETKSEIILRYSLKTGMLSNLATDSNKETVTITCEGFETADPFKDKPFGIKLFAKSKDGQSVSIDLDPPKRPWESGGDPETMSLLLKLLEEKKFEEIEERFFIQKIK